MTPLVQFIDGAKHSLDGEVYLASSKPVLTALENPGDWNRLGYAVNLCKSLNLQELIDETVKPVVKKQAQALAAGQFDFNRLNQFYYLAQNIGGQEIIEQQIKPTLRRHFLALKDKPADPKSFEGQAWWLARSLQIKEAVPIALKHARAKSAPAYSRGNAIFYVGQLGTKEEIAQLEGLLTRTLAAIEAHPGIARVPLANVPTGPGATRVADRMLAILSAGGVDDQSAAWFLDDGEGSERYAGTFRGRGISSDPLHLVRVDLRTGAVSLTEVCGKAGGLIANPPAVDAGRGIAVGYDSANGVMTAFEKAVSMIPQTTRVMRSNISASSGRRLAMRSSARSFAGLSRAAHFGPSASRMPSSSPADRPSLKAKIREVLMWTACGSRFSSSASNTCHCSSPQSSACCLRPVAVSADFADRRASNTPFCDVPPRAIR